MAVLATAREHLSADDIASQVEELTPGLHRTTIYRTLESLCASGVAVHVHLAQGATTYHLTDIDDRPHLHVLCDSCGAVLDAPANLLDEVGVRLLADLDFELEPTHAALLGRCGRCRASEIKPG